MIELVPNPGSGELLANLGIAGIGAAVQVEAAVTAWLADRGIEAPSSTGDLKRMDLRVAAVERMVHDDPSGAVDLLEHLGPEHSYAEALAFAESLTRQGQALHEALERRRRERKRGRA